MRKYRVKAYESMLGNLRYGVDMRFFLIFWIPCESFTNKEEAISHCNKLNEKISC
jgi:hypothetical protein